MLSCVVSFDHPALFYPLFSLHDNSFAFIFLSSHCEIFGLNTTFWSLEKIGNLSLAKNGNKQLFKARYYNLLKLLTHFLKFSTYYKKNYNNNKSNIQIQKMTFRAEKLISLSKYFKFTRLDDLTKHVKLSKIISKFL